MKAWAIPVIRKQYGIKIIEAKTKEEAIEKALDDNIAMVVSPLSIYELNPKGTIVELE